MLQALGYFIPILISVAFLTLTERKVIGYMQARRGPNVVGIYGLGQPIADGVKLFTKEFIIPSHVSLVIYFLAPIVAFILGLGVWVFLPWKEGVVLVDWTVGLLFVFAMSSVSVYAVLLSGWSSNSKYAFLGALRAAAQMISYEVCIGLILMTVVLCTGSLNLHDCMIAQNYIGWCIIPLWPAAIMFFVSCLAETNRAPFDLTEGESELVSGFNVEYSAMPFALFFLAEYSHIIFMSMLFTVLFLGGGSQGILFFAFKGMCIVFLFIWVRASFPRLRYDQLMHLLWKTYLPFSIACLIFTHSILWACHAFPPISCLS